MLPTSMTADDPADDVPLDDARGATTEALTADPRPAELRVAPSLVLVNTGNGKGKSSAAFGVMLRALSRGAPELEAPWRRRQREPVRP